MDNVSQNEQLAKLEEKYSQMLFPVFPSTEFCEQHCWLWGYVSYNVLKLQDLLNIIKNKHGFVKRPFEHLSPEQLC